MSLLRLVVPLLLLAAASAVPAADGPSALLLALNKGDHTLAIVDATTLQVLGRAASGPDPHEVVGSADGTLAYITNYTAGNGFANSLSVVDLTTRKALPPIDLGSMSRPHGLALASGRIYFTAEGSRSIGRYDPSSRKVDWTLSTGQDGTHMIIAASDLRRLFTSNLGSASVCASSMRQEATGASLSCRSAAALKGSTSRPTARSCGWRTRRMGRCRSSTRRPSRSRSR